TGADDQRETAGDTARRSVLDNENDRRCQQDGRPQLRGQGLPLIPAPNATHQPPAARLMSGMISAHDRAPLALAAMRAARNSSGGSTCRMAMTVFESRSGLRAEGSVDAMCPGSCCRLSR